MRELTVNCKIFTFDELTQKAKQKAMEEGMVGDYFDHIYTEANKSIDEMRHKFKVIVSEWSYDYGYRQVGEVSSRYDIVDDEMEEDFVSHIKEVSSRYDENPFTGYCYDEYLLKPIYEDLKKRKKATVDDACEAIRKGVENLIKKIMKEVETLREDEENFAEKAKYNGWEFYEDGSMV